MDTMLQDGRLQDSRDNSQVDFESPEAKLVAPMRSVSQILKQVRAETLGQDQLTNLASSDITPDSPNYLWN